MMNVKKYFYPNTNISQQTRIQQLRNGTKITDKQYIPLPNKYKTIMKNAANYKLLSKSFDNIFFIPIISLISFIFGYNVGQITNTTNIDKNKLFSM